MGKKLEKYLEAAKKPATKSGVVMKFGKKGGNDTLSFSKGKVFDAYKTAGSMIDFIEKNIAAEQAKLRNKILKIYVDAEKEVYDKYGEDAEIEFQQTVDEILYQDETISGIIKDSIGGGGGF